MTELIDRTRFGRADEGEIERGSQYKSPLEPPGITLANEQPFHGSIEQGRMFIGNGMKIGHSGTLLSTILL
jgi:hypothetical protein